MSKDSHLPVGLLSGLNDLFYVKLSQQIHLVSLGVTQIFSITILIKEITLHFNPMRLEKILRKDDRREYIRLRRQELSFLF